MLAYNTLITADFRPISVTPILSRLSEKLIVTYYLKPAFSSVQLLLDQFAYKNSGSTNCALIQMLDFITRSLDSHNCEYVTAVFVDLSKAFDVVDHDILLTKLLGLNLPPNIYSWIKSFLTDRRQIVKGGGCESGMESITRGVVQGSAIGPYLFLLMMSDLSPISTQSLIVKYADDLILLVPDGSDTSVKEEHQHIKNWAKTNDQTVNEKKTKLSIFRRPRSKLVDDVSGCQIEKVEKFKLLGVTLDNKLTFVTHITDVLSACSQRLYLLKLLRDHGMPPSCLHIIFVSLVVNKITYCISAWGGFIRKFYTNKINSAA